MKLVFITDVHANLPALRAALEAIEAEGYDLLVHGGDAIAIGPHPAECLDVLLSLPRARFVMGNHDHYFVRGLPDGPAGPMDPGEFVHQQWTHAQIDPALRAELARWPWQLDLTPEGIDAIVMHYGRSTDDAHFARFAPELTSSALDDVFVACASSASLILHGHDHRACDLEGRRRYFNPGSVGCWPEAIARYAVIRFGPAGCGIEQRSVPYDDAELFADFERRGVPEREMICRAFLGDRFSKAPR